MTVDHASNMRRNEQSNEFPVAAITGSGTTIVTATGTASNLERNARIVDESTGSADSAEDTSEDNFVVATSSKLATANIEKNRAKRSKDVLNVSTDNRSVKVSQRRSTASSKTTSVIGSIHSSDDKLNTQAAAEAARLKPWPMTDCCVWSKMISNYHATMAAQTPPSRTSPSRQIQATSQSSSTIGTSLNTDESCVRRIRWSQDTMIEASVESNDSSKSGSDEEDTAVVRSQTPPVVQPWPKSGCCVWAKLLSDYSAAIAAAQTQPQHLRHSAVVSGPGAVDARTSTEPIVGSELDPADRATEFEESPGSVEPVNGIPSAVVKTRQELSVTPDSKEVSFVSVRLVTTSERPTAAALRAQMMSLKRVSLIPTATAHQSGRAITEPSTLAAACQQTDPAEKAIMTEPAKIASLTEPTEMEILTDAAPLSFTVSNNSDAAVVLIQTPVFPLLAAQPASAVEEAVTSPRQDATSATNFDSGMEETTTIIGRWLNETKDLD